RYQEPPGGKKRMGWKFKWLSSSRTDFNYDYQASFTPKDIRSRSAYIEPVALRVGRHPLRPCEMPGTADHISGRKVHSTRARMQCASDSRTDTRPISHPGGMGAWSPPSRCGRASGMLSGSAHGSDRASWE